MSKILKFSLRFALALIVAACFHQAAHAQIGAGNVSLSLDSGYVANGYGDSTGAAVTSGTTLTGYVYVNGVSGNGGTTYVTCSDSVNGTVFSTSSSDNISDSFTYTISGAGTHYVSCDADYQGNYANGDAPTGSITIDVQ